jgi:hypothetical protein
MDFKKNNFCIVKKVVNSEIADFAYKYFLLKREVAKTFFQLRYISTFNEEWGTWNDPQAPNTYSVYGDILMENLLQKVKPIMEEKTGIKLIETYSYARIYKKGDVLHRHKDRFSCEISTTLNLGGDPWPIFINPNKKEGYVFGEKKGVHGLQNYSPSISKGVKILLNPGDMLVYRGNMLEHWREEFKGENCGQVFLHYNNAKTKGAKENIYDRRPHLGLPSWFKQK